MNCRWSLIRDITPLLLLFLLMACQPAPTPSPPAPVTPTAAPVSVQIGLSSSAMAIASLVGDVYAQEQAEVVIAFTRANHATLFADLESGQLDALLVQELPGNSGYWFNPVALDGLVIVVHPANPIRALSRAEVQAIFNGRISHWSTLGGADEPIHLISRERESGVRAIFSERVMGEQRLAVTAQVQPDHESLLNAVAADPQAIGYSMMGSLSTAVTALVIDGWPATPATTASQTYPLTVPLYFVSRSEPNGELRAWLAWLQSPTGQTILGEKYGRVR
jgi:ABC-type phosphate transport system substrate-binding protein